MSKRVSFIMEIIVALAIFWIGISGANVMFISGTRSAAITLGTIGLLFYITSVLISPTGTAMLLSKSTILRPFG